jgi:hypothetical protein
MEEQMGSNWDRRGSGRGKMGIILMGIFLSVVLSGCGMMTVKHVSPDEPNALEKKEGVVFGRVVFISHSEALGEVRFRPLGLGLFHVDTGNRASRVVVLKKTVVVTPPSGDRYVRDLPIRKRWFEDDGTFFWILPEGDYQIDALGWGFQRKVSAADLKEKETEGSFSLTPERPPACGFAINPAMGFKVSGDGTAVYIGSLLVDMDIATEKGIEIKKINRLEVRDDYDDAKALLGVRYPSFALMVGKRLMSPIPGRQVLAANRRCPTWAEVALGFMIGTALQMGPVFLHAVPTMAPSISIPMH